MRAPRTTSTTFISGTGLKKWYPATRSGRLHAAAIAVIDSEDVLLTSTASGATIASSSMNKSRFTSRRSTIASMTRSQSAKPCRASFGVMRARVAAAASAVIRPFSTSLPKVSRRLSIAAATAAGWVSYSTMSQPA